MGLWNTIIVHTSSSPFKLVVFGTLFVGATAVVGSAFSKATTSGLDDRQRKAQLEQLPYDQRRMALSQQQRLSAMIRDIGEGRADHWSTVMKGTLVPHPMEENKTQGIDNIRIVQAAAATPAR